MNTSSHRIRFRSERFFHVLGEGWYFEAREGLFGPHESRKIALKALTRLIERCPRKRTESATDKAA